MPKVSGPIQRVRFTKSTLRHESTMADIEQTLLSEEVETSGGGVGAMESMIRGLQAQIHALEAQLSAKGGCRLRRPVQAEAHRRE